MAWRRLTFALVLACAAPAAAQTPPASPSDEEVVVTGRRVDEAIQNFVQELSAAPSNEDQLARWDEEVCVGVIGIRARYGQFLVDRISQRAVALGLRAGAPGCRANVVVFVTPDSDALARNLLETQKTMLGDVRQDNTNTRGHDALEAFVNTPRPVRWWHVSYTTTNDGQRLYDLPVTHAGDMLRTQIVRTTSLGFGRLSRTTRQDFSRVIIIVDATRARGMQFDSLADYVSMVALSQVDPDADTNGLPTILNLFSDAAGRPTALTDWDEAYLEGLYAARRNARNSRAQEGDIARRMGQEVTTAPPEPAPQHSELEGQGG